MVGLFLSSPPSGMILACGFGTHASVACEDAHGLRAGARIVVLGGRCAERKVGDGRRMG
jgi:hypothetical protein